MVSSKNDRYSAKEMLAKLISFDTTSRNSNLPLLDFVKDYLAQYGIACEYVYHPSGKKANLFATLGPNQAGGIVFSGHTDVVPVDGQSWDSDPFHLTEKGDRLYGRGTCDMKGFSAAALALVPEMVAKPLTRPLHFALSFDEEVSDMGAKHLIRQLGKELPMPSIILVGEPSMMKVVSAHKGIVIFKIIAKGKEAHSSLTHQGVSAVTACARVITKIQEMAEERKQFHHSKDSFDPPYTTLHVGMIHGGTAANIISGHCEAVLDIRYIPEDNPHELVAALRAWITKELHPAMKAIDPACGVEIIIDTETKAFAWDPTSEAEEFVRSITGDNQTRFVSYCTEAGLYQQQGPSVVICGPGSIEQAHQPNEFLSIEQLDLCTAFLQKVIAKCR